MSVLNNAIIRVPEPANEPQFDYAVNSEARSQLKDALSQLAEKRFEIPLIIGGKEVKTGNLGQVVMPHDHGHVLANYHKAGEKEVQMAIAAALSAKNEWQRLRWEERTAIFLKAAELISGKYRYQINAASMLSTSKNAYQAEIDAACELIDFLRFNVFFAQTIYEEQPLYSSKGTWNFTQYRPLEGFIMAITPFNFTAIAGNLAAAPAIMGNTVILKPASSCVYTPYLLMQIFREAGLPNGVINFLPGSGSIVGDICLEHFSGGPVTATIATFIVVIADVDTLHDVVGIVAGLEDNIRVDIGKSPDGIDDRLACPALAIRNSGLYDFEVNGNGAAGSLGHGLQVSPHVQQGVEV